jgi:hypothetical protein
MSDVTGSPWLTVSAKLLRDKPSTMIWKVSGRRAGLLPPVAEELVVGADVVVVVVVVVVVALLPEGAGDGAGGEKRAGCVAPQAHGDWCACACACGWACAR